MRRYIQLDANNLAVSEVESAGMPTSDRIIDVTGRTDGPWLGKIYDAGTDTFSVPPVEVRPLTTAATERLEAENLVNRHQASLSELEKVRLQQLILKLLLNGGTL